MVDYYQILGVPESANQEQIKRAFKRLALRYHPDRNPDNPAAEERFKEINLAYQTLSDYSAKASYDARRRYGYEASTSHTPRRPPPYTTTRRPDPYGRPFQPKQTSGRYYDLGWNYVKHQAMAFGFVLIVAIGYLTIKGIIDYQRQAAYEELIAERTAYLDTAKMEFRSGNYEASFDLIKMINKTYPPAADIYDYKNKSLRSLTKIADDSLNSENYLWAARNYDIVRENSNGLNIDLYHKIALCYKGMGQYEKAAQVLDYILIRDFENLELNLEIASIYRDVLNQPAKAREYYERAKKKIKEQLKATYGDAYEIVMDPSYSPPLYHRVFFNAALNSAKLEDHDETIKNANWTVFFRPDLPEGYFIRANSYHAMGRLKKACDNWQRAVELGHLPSEEAQSDHCR